MRGCLNRAREILVRLAQRHGVKLRQSYARVGKFALIQHQRYAHAKQFKRANRALKKLRTYLGRIIRAITRKIEGDDWLEQMVFGRILPLARQVRETAIRWPPSFRRWKRSSATPSSASWPIRAIAATMRHPITSSGCSRQARSAG